jgi:hypothetical protein
MSFRSSIRSALVFAAALLLSVSANAQLFRAYLAPTGVDTNPCTLPAPCRLLPAALAAVADGGEIWMLDSANYNTATVTIDKSVSILAVPGAVGSVLAIGGRAITITAASLKVALRNLVIVPLAGGGGTHGVYMTGASSLTIEDSLIANLPQHGVWVAGTGTLKITNTILRNNGSYAVMAQNGANVSISGAKMLGNGAGGVQALGGSASTTTTAVVSDSVISGGTQGVYAVALASANAQVYVTRCTIENVGTALYSLTGSIGSALISVSNSMIAKNLWGLEQSGTGSIIKSAGNNYIDGNTNAPIGVLTPAALQ